MSAFRMVAVDVDGTLVDRHEVVRPRVARAVRAVAARGVELVLATGRGPRMVRPVLEALGVPAGLVMANGALVAEALDKPPVVERMLPVGLAREALAAYRAAGFEPIVFDDPRVSERVAIERETGQLAPFVAKNEFRLNRVPDLWSWLDHPVLMLCTFGPETSVRGLAERLCGEFGGRVSVQPMLHPKYGLWVCDLFAPECSKWSGLRGYAAHRGVGTDEVLAVGDGLNDIPMLTGAGYGIAMASAEPEVLAVADEVVADVDHDGLAEALERHILGNGAEPR